MRLFSRQCILTKALSVAVAAALVAAPLAARAQTNPASPANQSIVPITGSATDGSQFAGTLHVQRFQQIGNRIYALGVLNGTLGNQAVTNQPVALPVITGASNGRGNDNGNPGGPTGEVLPELRVRPAFAAGSSLTDQPLIITTQTCPILNLTLGPLDLNLLGLMVHLNQVVLNITAQGGAGNLLGNLLCAVANLLNGPNLGALTNLLNGIVNILNGILAGL